MGESRGTAHVIGHVAIVGLLLLESATSSAAVLCVKMRRDGSLRGVVRVREECKKREVQLDAQAMDLCCEPATTTTVTTTTTTSCPILTTSTLGRPSCEAFEVCGGTCDNGRECVQGEVGCECSGALVQCQTVGVGSCNGFCPGSQTCVSVRPLQEDGCPGAPICACIYVP
jgi:hypothetical protein